MADCEMKVLVFPFDNKRRVKFYLVTDRKENSHYAQNRAPYLCVKNCWYKHTDDGNL